MMTDFEKLTIERDAYRYWLGLTMMHAGTGIPITRQHITDHIRDLKNGVPLEHLRDDLTPAQWDIENFRRLPIYEAVAMEIVEQITSYEMTGRISDLAFDK
jgi:hypothetical protein